jgi:hypothetical protein
LYLLEDGVIDCVYQSHRAPARATRQQAAIVAVGEKGRLELLSAVTVCVAKQAEDHGSSLMTSLSDPDQYPSFFEAPALQRTSISQDFGPAGFKHSSDQRVPTVRL